MFKTLILFLNSKAKIFYEYKCFNLFIFQSEKMKTIFNLAFINSTKSKS
jgi:hypothetical protein